MTIPGCELIREDWTTQVTSRELTFFSNLPCFTTNHNHFEPSQDIIRTNVLIIFSLIQNVTCRVQTRFYYSHIKKNALPENCPAPGGHVFQPTGTIFELIQDIIGTCVLTKFYKDWTINVPSKV
ncbi:hypothetical protein DPMN_133144 [Dreissena polymorpha]|uniref:Uncharacterized protein n=1 Tax=Dreissena polymorpha TaxID=45954 RepID=A0A9D4FUN8_DREPO|nr:hypothetical protein DPMN_133144 [Dreissena polymorpha]